MKTQNVLVCIVLSALTACLGPTAVNRVEGNVSGQGIDVKDAVFLLTPVPVPPAAAGGDTMLTLILSDQDNLCERLKKGDPPKGTKHVLMELVQFGEGGQPLPPTKGTYVVDEFTSPVTGPGARGVSAFYAFDAEGQPTVVGSEQLSVSGEVRIETYTEKERLVGSFEITYGTQKDSLKGSFSATYCAASN